MYCRVYALKGETNTNCHVKLERKNINNLKKKIKLLFAVLGVKLREIYADETK